MNFASLLSVGAEELFTSSFASSLSADVGDALSRSPGRRLQDRDSITGFKKNMKIPWRPRNSVMLRSNMESKGVMSRLKMFICSMSPTAFSGWISSDGETVVWRCPSGGALSIEKFCSSVGRRLWYAGVMESRSRPSRVRVRRKSVVRKARTKPL